MDMFDPTRCPLFHLVPLNNTGFESLSHPNNRNFVSEAAANKLGLGVGFHVSRIHGHVITRLGRNPDVSDLILERGNVSGQHVAFEMHPETLLVLLSVRTTQQGSVRIMALECDQEGAEGQAAAGEALNGDYVLTYGQQYQIDLADYSFRLVWRYSDPTPMKELAVTQYIAAQQKACDVRPCDRPTEIGPGTRTYHNTRPYTARQNQVEEKPGHTRELVGKGRFGEVYSTVALNSNEPFAVKVIQLKKYPEPEVALASAHREIKVLERLRKHPNIIELLGYDKWRTDTPELFMPLAKANLGLVAQSLPACKDAQQTQQMHNKLALTVLEQMLSALDHLTCNSICHLDVKPENILYFPDEGYIFKLADFGLAIHPKLATPDCGTSWYRAPEQSPESNYELGPKTDVWSLFATVAAINPMFDFPPPRDSPREKVLAAVLAAAEGEPLLAPMTRINPQHRASAAQMLVRCFNGLGLTTPLSEIHEILDPSPSDPIPPRTRKRRTPLVQYPPRRSRRHDLYARGVVKRKTPVPPVRAVPADGPLAEAILARLAEAATLRQAAVAQPMDWEVSPPLAVDILSRVGATGG